jgi:hypothetical protein
VSAAGRGGPRHDHDFYPTPAGLAAAALAHVDITGSIGHSLTIVDPGAGLGEWGAAARHQWPDARIIGVDIAQRDPAGPCYDAWHVADYLTWARSVPDEDRPDVIMGNPPYNLAEDFIRASLSLIAPGGRVVFLLRLAFLESQKRAALWRDHKPARVSVLTARPSFTGDGRSDAAAYAVFLWTCPAPHVTALDWLHWQPDRRSPRAIALA